MAIPSVGLAAYRTPSGVMTVAAVVAASVVALSGNAFAQAKIVDGPEVRWKLGAWGKPRAATQNVETLRKLVRRQRIDSCRRKLDGQRQAVKLMTDLSDWLRDAVRQRKAGHDRGCPIHE